MNEPTKIGPLLRDYVERARLAGDARCSLHPSEAAVRCNLCFSDARVAGDIGQLREMSSVAAMGACDRLFPRRWRDAEPTEPAILEWVRTVAVDLAEAPSLLLLGATGAGKTYQAYGALRAAVLAHPRASWATTTYADFTAALRPRPKVDTEAEMDRFRSVDLLLVDDLAAAKSSEWVEEVTYRLVNGRYEDMRPSIFTSNLALAELKEAIGDRVASRLAETCVRVVLDGPDRRRQPKAA